MKQQDAKPEQALPHDLILEGRNKLSVTSLDLDKGEVKLTGRVDTLEYTAEHTPGGFLRRLVR